MDDDISDGNQGYVIELSDNSSETLATEYQDLNPPDVVITNVDNETAGYTIKTL